MQASYQLRALLAEVGVTSTEGLNVADLEKRFSKEIRDIDYVSECCRANETRNIPLTWGRCADCKECCGFIAVDEDGELLDANGENIYYEGN